MSLQTTDEFASCCLLLIDYEMELEVECALVARLDQETILQERIGLSTHRDMRAEYAIQTRRNLQIYHR